MAVFDVFIRGVRPERQDESEKIKQKVCEFLKIEETELTAAWATRQGYCVRSGIGEQEAQKIQTSLAKGGVICIYKPAARSEAELSIVTEQQEEISETRKFSCPRCSYEELLKFGNPEPVKCPKCFVLVEAHRKHLSEQEERNAVRVRLMQSKSYQNKLEDEKKKTEAERKRKMDLEEEVRRELFGDEKSKLGSVDKRLVISGAAVIVLALSIGGYSFFWSGKANSCSSSTSVQSAEPVIGFAADDDSNGEHTDGQMALQGVHDKANKVLGAFGLDADNFATKLTGVKTDKNVTKKLYTGTPNALPSNLASEGEKNSPSDEKDATMVTLSLLHDGENNQELDLFFSQRVVSLIGRSTLDDAYAVAQQIVDTEDYINSMMQLMASAQQYNQPQLLERINAAIDKRIESQTLANHVIYLAQAGFYQQRVTGKRELFAKAEQLWQTIGNPVDKLNSALKIATYNFKAGDTDTANMYFNQADSLLAQHNTVNQQVSGRAAIARAYNDINDRKNAIKWLDSTEELLPSLNNDTLKELMISYAYTNQWKTKLLNTLAKEKQPEIIYSAIQATLKNNSTEVAIALKKELKNPRYQALASDLISSYDPTLASYSLDYAEKLLPSIELAADKAIISSRLSRHYARLGNSQKVKELNASTELLLTSIPVSNTRDSVSALIIKNYGQSLQFDMVNRLLSFIQDEAVKSSVRNDIAQLQELSKLNI